jgi:DNA mismatch repair protein MutS
MMRQFLEVKAQHAGTLLFYRMGDFYETFFEDALIAARVLDITLTGRDAGKLGHVPMAGIPVKAVESYLPKLMAKQLKVAICEQIDDAPPPQATSSSNSDGKSLVARRVVRVLSTGTLVEPNLLEAHRAQYLAALLPGKKTGATSTAVYGLAVCDCSTGDFWAGEGSFDRIWAELDRLNPSELLVPGANKTLPGGAGVPEWQPEAPPEIQQRFACTALPPHYVPASGLRALKQLFGLQTLEGFGLAPLAQDAASAMAAYLQQTFLDGLPAFDGIRPLRLHDVVRLNAAARRNLEITSPLRREGKEGSLLGVLDETLTAMGARLLRSWIGQPLMDLAEIHSRLDGVEELVEQQDWRHAVREHLPDVADLERLAARLASGSIGPRDFVALGNSLLRLAPLMLHLAPATSFYLARANYMAPELATLAENIHRTLTDAPPNTLKEPGMLRPGVLPELDRLRDVLQNQAQWLAAFEQNERERTGIKTLKVQENSAFGFYIEVTKANLALVPDDYQRKQTLAQVERYVTPALAQFEQDVTTAKQQVQRLETEYFLTWRGQMMSSAPWVKDVAHRVAALDVLQSWATVAVQRDYVRPVVEHSGALEIEAGRHPVVESLLPMGQFVANPCGLWAQDSRPAKTLSPGAIATADDIENTVPPCCLLITGPNMAGKSTYMRQTALIVLMAQIGCFVPAASVRVGCVDAIFTRVGASDDISGGQSTFMVEMLETAEILHGATPQSLVLMDEVGRGTSTFDGISIAWSVAEHLATAVGCRTLFATHYHELNALEAQFGGKIKNLRVCVAETPEGITFLHAVESGAAQKSYGLQVARMAGVPGQVIQRANRLLVAMMKRDLGVSGGTKNNLDSATTGAGGMEEPQLSLF